MANLYPTNFRVAVDWLNLNLILCNGITEIDPSVWDNMRFDTYDEETEEYTEIYQYYLTSASSDDVRWLEEHFGLQFTYSELLDLYILCVTHYGTSWDYVYWECDFPQAERALGERK